MSFKINKYPDGTSYVNDITFANLNNVFKINSYEDLWHLNQFVDAYVSKHNSKPNITIPNLIDAQADRRFNDGESYGLKLVLKFLKSLPVDTYYIFHPHNQEVVESMLDNVQIMDNTGYVMRVLHEYINNGEGIQGLYQNNLILMSSDAGGFKPLMKLSDRIGWRGETFSAAKSRSWDGESGTKFVQKVDREDFNGKDIMIVDDICVYGGTFIGLAKMLRERNIGKLYLTVSHMTVEKPNPLLFDLFDRVFTSNSKFDNYYVPKGDGGVQPSNLEVIKLFEF